MIKLVAVDVDDTLLNSQGKILESSREAITKAISKNVKVVLCSGRPYAGVKKFIDELALNNNNQYVITFNGAVIETGLHVKLLEKCLSAKTYEAIDKFSQKNKVFYNIVNADSQIITSNLNVGRITVTQAWENNAGILIRKPQDLSSKETVIKAVFGDEKGKLDKIEAEVKHVFGQDNYVVRAAVNFLEVMHANVNKGIALQYLAQKLNYKTEEIMAIGDERNDIPMFQVAGTSVVMNNGSAEAKKQADFETASNDQDGIALAFSKFVFDK